SPTKVSRADIRPISKYAVRHLADAQSLPLAAVAPAQSRDHLRGALDEARTVMQVVRLLDYPRDIYQIDDVPVEASLMRSPDLAAILAARLAPLNGSGAPLIETLRVSLESSQDRRDAASTLYIHPNTLDYRLRRIRELTGLSPTVPRDIQMLGRAFTAGRLLGL